MNTINPLLPLLLGGFLAASLPLQADTTSKETAGQYIDDSVITTKVKSAIVTDAKLPGVKVETYKGVVQLSGFVATQADIDKAGKLASAVVGVKSVKNDIQLKS